MTEPQVSDYTADKIREARRQLKWSTGDLALRCGLTRSIIENIEGGRRDAAGRRRREISIDELFAISEAFGVAPLKLLPARKPLPVIEREAMIERARHELHRQRQELAMLSGRMNAAEYELTRVREDYSRAAEIVDKSEMLLVQLEAAD